MSDDLKAAFEAHSLQDKIAFAEGERRMDLLLIVQQQQGDALARIEKNTAGIVEWSNNIKGTMEVGRSVERFGTWLLKMGMIGTGLFAFFVWAYETFKHRG